MDSHISSFRNSQNGTLLFLLPMMVTLVLIVSIVSIISIIWMISLIGAFLIAFLIPISILVILLIILSYLSGNILYFSIFFDDYSQKTLIFRIIHIISNFPCYGVQDVYQLVVTVLVNLKQFSNYLNRRRSGNMNINVFRVFSDDRDERKEEFINEETLNNIFEEN